MCQPVCRPRNGIGLAASGAVLDQVIMPGSVGALVKGQEIGVLSGELCGHPHRKKALI